MENKDREIHIWHDNSGSDNYDLFFDIEDPNETAPPVLLLHCHEDEYNYRERWQMELASTNYVQQTVNAERDRATARENQIENKLDTCCNEVKGRLDTAESDITQNQTNIQHLQTDVTNLHNTVNTLDGRVSANETSIVNLQRDVQNAQNTANTASTTAQQAQQVANDAHTSAQQAQTTANAVSSTAQQAQQTAQQAQTTANAVSSVAQQTTNDVLNLQRQLQQSNQTITDLQTQLQGALGVWDYIPYFLSINDTVDGLHIEITHDLTSWINTFPTPQQIEDKLKNGRYRLFINTIADQGKPVTAYINDYQYFESTKTLHIEYSATSHAVLGVTLMTN